MPGSLPLRNLCFDDRHADREITKQCIKNQLERKRKESFRVDREDFPEGTKV